MGQHLAHWLAEGALSFAPKLCHDVDLRHAIERRKRYLAATELLDQRFLPVVWMLVVHVLAVLVMIQVWPIGHTLFIAAVSRCLNFRSKAFWVCAALFYRELLYFTCTSIVFHMHV
jgi:hypothetical protein